ncbi:MAG: hypothetical protein ABSG30_05830 [Steroidobacteraceae bacterium]|jgi:hypothetical protein
MPKHRDPSGPSVPALDEAIQRYYGLGEERNRADPAQRGILFEMLAAIEDEPSIVGASAHLIAVARK